MTVPPEAIDDLADEVASHHAVTVCGREGYEAVKARLRQACAVGAAAERDRIDQDIKELMRRDQRLIYFGRVLADLLAGDQL